MQDIDEAIEKLFGNSMLAAFCVVHWGLLNASDRENLMLKWIHEVSLRTSNYSKNFDLCIFIAGSLRNTEDKFWSSMIIADQFLKENLLIAGNDNNSYIPSRLQKRHCLY